MTCNYNCRSLRNEFPQSGNHSLLVEVILFGDADSRVPKKTAGHIDSRLFADMRSDGLV